MAKQILKVDGAIKDTAPRMTKEEYDKAQKDRKKVKKSRKK